MRPEQTRTYDRASSVVFLKTHEAFGGLSNMAGGFPLRVNGIRILTSEALYQACRFPHRPEVQTLIIEQKSPMTAKMKSKPYRHDSRPDWNQIRVNVMRWCLRIKVAQNWVTFSKLLLETGERPIVEESRKDSFWGAMANDDGTLSGMNVLGRLLMELREMAKQGGRQAFMRVEPLAIPDFLLANKSIEPVVSRGDAESGRTSVVPVRPDVADYGAPQSSLFGESAVMEAPPAYPTFIREGVQIAGLKPYPDYRTAEDGWIGEIPSHWKVRRMKYVVREIDSRSKTGKEQLLQVSQYTGVTQRLRDDGLEEPDTRADSLVGYKRVEPSDLVVNIMLAWNGSMGVSRYEGIVSPAYCVYRFGPDLHPWYFHNLLRSPPYKARIKASSTGVVESRLRLYSDDLGCIEAIVPPPDEQVAIVRFLDWANGRLERAIRAKRKVIALLNEQKQVIIHRAVTQGLDPSVALRPSGIPWLGDIPQHWEVRRLKHCISPIEQGWSPQCDAQPAGEDEWGVLKVGCVNKESFSPKQNKKLPDTLQPDYSLEVWDGDILVSRANTRELLGLAALVEDPPRKLILCDKLFRFRAKRSTFNPRFLVLSLRARPCREQIESSTNGASSSMQNIGQGVLKNLWVAKPPAAEQMRIVAHITEVTKPAGAAIARLEREIELLREYRTRLVADVVTGKLDVRGAAARLPDDAPLDSAEVDAESEEEVEAADEEAVA